MHDPNSVAGRMARVIWEASRADEGTISAIGADNVASALEAEGFGETFGAAPEESLSGMSLREVLVAFADFTFDPARKDTRKIDDIDEFLEGLWPAKVSFPDAWLKPLIMTIGGPLDPKDPATWNIQPGRIVEVPPDPMERIAEALEDIGPTIREAVKEALLFAAKPR